MKMRKFIIQKYLGYEMASRNVPVLLFVPPRQSITLAGVSGRFRFFRSCTRTYGTVLNRLRKDKFLLLADIEIPASIYELSFPVS